MTRRPGCSRRTCPPAPRPGCRAARRPAARPASCRRPGRTPSPARRCPAPSGRPRRTRGSPGNAPRAAWPAPGRTPHRSAAAAPGRSAVGIAGLSSTSSPDDRGVQVLLERNPAGQALIQHTAQRVLIGQPGHRGTPDLLRRDIINSAQELARRGQPAAGHRVLGDPEVRQVDVIGISLVAAPLDQQVPRLHIPVHQPLPVRGVKPPRGLARQEQRGHEAGSARAF